MVLRFIGLMYLLEPIIIWRTMNRPAFSVGWNGSQNAYKLLSGHRLENLVHSPSPLFGPCPQHASFEVINPVSSTQQCRINRKCKVMLINSTRNRYLNLPKASGLEIKSEFISLVLAATKISAPNSELSWFSICVSWGSYRPAALCNSAAHSPLLRRRANSEGTHPKGPTPVTRTLRPPRSYICCHFI